MGGQIHFVIIPLIRRASVALLVAFFAVSLGGVYHVVARFPPLPEALMISWNAALERSAIGILQNPLPSDLRLLRSTVEYYMIGNYWSVFSVLCTIYVFLQAFAIPGPAIFAILMAALFGGWVGGIMSMACSVVGSSLCYYLFKVIGGPILEKYFSKRLNKFRTQLLSHSDNLLFYFLFLRITPIVPNFFLNISSGNLGVPYWIFFIGTSIGLIPNAVILARVGVEIATLQDEQGTGLKIDATRAIGLLLIGLLSLIPVLLKRKVKV